MLLRPSTLSISRVKAPSLSAPNRCCAAARCPSPRPSLLDVQKQRAICCRAFHASRCLRADVLGTKNHYERLNVRHDATPAQIKKSFYALSKTHHPDANRNNPDAASTFSLLSESYTILSDPSRRATYDRDVLRVHQQQHSRASSSHPHGSFHSTNPAGGRAPSGLSRRRTTFRGPPPSFYRSGGWGTQAERRKKAHDESTGGAENNTSSSSSSERKGYDPWGAYGGMGPGSDPYNHRYDADFAAPHFDKESHRKTQAREDKRRWERAKRAYGDDDVEFEPQTSLGAHFLIVAGILGVTVMAPMVYLQFLRLSRAKRERGIH